MLSPQWHIERWHDVKYVTKHLSCAIWVTNALINLACVPGAKRGGRGGRTPATQATVNSEMTTPHPHLPRRVICQQCSMGPEATQQRVVRGGSAPRGQV